jgi:hypothetical protein
MTISSIGTDSIRLDKGMRDPDDGTHLLSYTHFPISKVGTYFNNG